MSIGRLVEYVTRGSRQNEEQLEKERHVHVWFRMALIPAQLVKAGNSSTSLSIFSIKIPEQKGPSVDSSYILKCTALLCLSDAVQVDERQLFVLYALENARQPNS